jgi:hypothetical protein
VSKLKYAEELDTMKVNGMEFSEPKSEDVAAKAWLLARFLGGRYAYISLKLEDTVGGSPGHACLC